MVCDKKCRLLWIIYGINGNWGKRITIVNDLGHASYTSILMNI